MLPVVTAPLKSYDNILSQLMRECPGEHQAETEKDLPLGQSPCVHRGQPFPEKEVVYVYSVVDWSV